MVLAIRWAMIPKITIAHIWKQSRIVEVTRTPEAHRIPHVSRKYSGQHDWRKMKGFGQPEITPQTSHKTRTILASCNRHFE